MPFNDSLRRFNFYQLALGPINFGKGPDRPTTCCYSDRPQTILSVAVTSRKCRFAGRLTGIMGACLEVEDAYRRHSCRPTTQPHPILCTILITQHIWLPVVPHKAVAEVSKIGRYRRGELLWCMDGRANPLMDRKVVVLFRVVAVVTSPTTAGRSVV